MYKSNKKNYLFIFQHNVKSKLVFLVSANSRTNTPCTVVSCTVRHKFCRRCRTTEEDQTGKAPPIICSRQQFQIVLLFKNNKLGDNCIQNFHLGRYIVGYTVGNLVLRRPARGAVKRYFRTYIRRYTSPNENF